MFASSNVCSGLDDVWTGINTRSTLLVWATAARYRNSMSIGLGDLAELN